MNYETIAAYLAGELSENEKQQVDNWVNASLENKQDFRRWQVLWQGSRQNIALFEPDVEKAWQKVNPGHIVPLQPAEPVAKPANVFYRLTRIAAILLITFGLGFTAIQAVHKFSKPSLSWVEKVTPSKVKTALTLPDGTIVWLNGNSKLRYPKKFSEDTREVYLEGEAFFDVHKNPRKPFLIHTGQTVTQVLGTSFNVRGYPNDSMVELAVVTGKVAFSFKSQSKMDSVVLQPQYKAVYVKGEDHIQVFASGDENFLAWKTGKLVFTNTPLRTTLQSLQNYYGVSFTTTDSTLLNCQFTGTFTNASLQDILDVFAFGRDISYKKEGNTYVLSGEGCE